MKGDFEMALLYYHRGHKSKPEGDEFRLGIQKAKEAINNAIGSNIPLQLHSNARNYQTPRISK